jgi:WD40 repeat protein
MRNYTLFLVASISLLGGWAYCETGAPTPIELSVQSGHSNSLCTLAFSEDKRFIVSGSSDGKAIAWDFRTGKQIRSFSSGENIVSSVSVSADCRLLATASQRSLSIDLYEFSNGKKIGSFDINESSVFVKLTARGDSIYCGGGNGNIYRITTSSGKIEKLIGVADRQLREALLTPDETRLLTLSPSGDRIGIWDLRSRKETAAICPESSRLNSFDYDADRHTIAAAAKGEIILYDSLSRLELKRIKFGADDLERPRFSPDGSKIAFVDRGGSSSNKPPRVRMIDRLGGDPVDLIESYSFETAFTEDGKSIVCAIGSDLLEIDSKSGELIRPFTSACSALASIARLPGQSSIVCAPTWGKPQRWDVDGLGMKPLLNDRGAYRCNSACASPDGGTLAVGSGVGEYKLYNLSNGRLQKIIQAAPGSGGPTALAFSPDGRYIASAGNSDGSISVRRTDNDAERTLKGHAGVVNALCFSPNGKMLLSVSQDKSIILWDSSTWSQIKRLTDEAWVNSATFFPDSKGFLMGDQFGIVTAWSVTGESLWRVEIKNREPINAIEISQSGDTALVCGWDKKIHLLNANTGRETREFVGHTSGVASVAYGKDGRHFFSGSGDGTMKMWSLASGDCVYTALADKEAAEWIIYTPDGYWDGSPGCGGLVAMTRGIECWNIDQFAVRNNRPDIIAQRAEAAPELVAELKSAWLKRLSRLGMSEVALSGDYDPPSASVESLRQEGPTTGGKFINLGLTFGTRGKSLKSYQVYVNDVPLYGAEGKPISGSEVRVTERVELVKGKNKIEASCMDSSGNESFRAYRAIAWSGEVKPNLYYLGFGVSDYSDPGIRKLKYAAKDALSLEAAFKGMAGAVFGRVFTKVYTDGAATKRAIAEARDFLGSARPDDTFVLFISGHGIRIGVAAASSATSDDTKGLSVSANGTKPRNTESKYYYITAETVLSNIPGTAADFELVEALLQGIAPYQKLFLIDTCQSGENDDSSPLIASAGSSRGLYARTLAPESQRGLAILPIAAAKVSAQRERWIYNDLARRSGAIVISACRGNEASLESDKWRQGAFTFEVLEALTDRTADKNNDGMISTDELRSYVAEKVPALVEQLLPGAQQHPTVDHDNIYSKFKFPLLAAGTSATASAVTASADAPAAPESDGYHSIRPAIDPVTWQRKSDGWFRFSDYEESDKSESVTYSSGNFVPSDPQNVCVEVSKTSGSLGLYFGCSATGPENDIYIIRVNNEGKFDIGLRDRKWKSRILASGSIAKRPLGAAYHIRMRWTPTALIFSIDSKDLYTEAAPAFDHVKTLSLYEQLSYKSKGPLSADLLEINARKAE